MAPVSVGAPALGGGGAGAGEAAGGGEVPCAAASGAFKSAALNAPSAASAPRRPRNGSEVRAKKRRDGSEDAEEGLNMGEGLLALDRPGARRLLMGT